MIRRSFFVALVTAFVAACSGGDEASAPSAIPPGAHRITVDGQGYHPASLELPSGAPATLVFTRTSDDGCGQQLVFPTLGIQRDLPLDEPVVVEIPSVEGEIRFTCGMDMYRGTIVAH